MKLNRLLAAASLCLASFSASADVITQVAPQTARGQAFEFSFEGLSTDFSGDAVMTIHARGDYSEGFSGGFQPYEILRGSAEFITFGPYGYDNADTRVAYEFDDTEWSRSFHLDHIFLADLLADGVLNVSIRLNDDVDLWFPDTAYVGVSLEYSPNAAEVPEPASLALFGLALAGIGAARRRKQK